MEKARDKTHGTGGNDVFRNKLIPLVALLMTIGLAAAALAQDAGQVPATTEESPAQLVFQVIPDGVVYDQNGNLLVRTLISNVGSQRSPSLNLLVVVLNDCILRDLPQTCRFLTMGTFEGVTPNGLAPGESIVQTLDFGPHPDIELSRWALIWYVLP